jgi:vacuolar-type H+-ATPase subunit E/Vma4
MKHEHTTEEEHPDGSAIIEGILKQAHLEAEKLVERARESADQRLKAVKRQADQDASEAEKEAERKREEILASARSTLEIEQRRRTLMIQESITEQVVEQASKRIEQMIGSSAYVKILEQLITEAALGIHTDEAIISASSKELPLIDEHMLDRVRKQIRKISGRDISLTISNRQPLPAQGVVLSSPDEKIAFSNQIPVRIRRMNSEIRHRIHKELFAPKPENNRGE